MKRLTTIRRSAETDRQIMQLKAELGETASEIQARAIALLWERVHARMHFDLAQLESGSCKWCGWDATPHDEND